MKTLCLAGMALMLVMTSCSLEKNTHNSGASGVIKNQHAGHNGTYKNCSLCSGPERSGLAQADQRSFTILEHVKNEPEMTQEVTRMAVAEPVLIASAGQANLVSEKLVRNEWYAGFAKAMEGKQGPNLSTKQLIKDLRALKKDARNTENSWSADDMMIVKVICAIFIPPLAVYLHKKNLGTEFWISLILTLLFWLPGIIYAFLIITDTI